MLKQRNILKSLIIISVLSGVATGVYNIIQAFSPSKKAISDVEMESQEEISRAPAASGSLLSEGVSPVVKQMNAAKSRSPAIDQPAATDAQIIAKFRDWVKKNGLREREDLMRHYFSGASGGEHLAMAMMLSTGGPVEDDMRDLHHWAMEKIYADPTGTATAIGSTLGKIARDNSGDRDWAISTLYSIAQKSEIARKDVRNTLLHEVNRQGIQTIEGMTTLVRVLRIQQSQEWVNEVRQEFEQMNPGSDLSEYVALKTE